MPSWLATILRWTLAIAGMGLVAWIAAPLVIDQLSGAITVDDGDDQARRGQPAGPPPVETGEDQAIIAVGMRNAVIRDVGSPLVFVGPGQADELLIGFEPLPPDPACMSSVTLEVSLVESHETHVYVRPGRVPDLPQRAEGEALPPDAFVDIAGPAVAITNGAPGWLRWDVTDAYALAATATREGGTVVLRVAPTPTEDAEAMTVLHTGAETAAERPRLSWAAVRGCEDLGIDVLSEPEQET